MADFIALRDEINRLIEGDGNLHVPAYRINNLFVRMEERFDGRSPVSRATFYGWFRKEEPKPPTASLLECVPALADILQVKEYQLYHVAKLLPPETEMTMSLSVAAREFRAATRHASQVLFDVGLASAGEALIVDRILHHDLDYKVTVWPVVRGAAKALHSRSWISIEPVESNVARQRDRTGRIEQLPEDRRRAYFRDEVLTEGLWRSLGLRWRYPQPLEWSASENSTLLIEMPVEERNREPGELPPASLSPSRALVLSGLWGHAEPLAASLASALNWGSYDLRYQGFRDETELEDKRRFSRDKLAEKAPHYAWAIAEDATFVKEIADDIVAAAGHHHIVWITYGSALTATAALAWRRSEDDVTASQTAVRNVVQRINETHPVIWVDHHDADLSYPGADAESRINRDLLADHVRYSAAVVLNELHRRGGPPLQWWGALFDDLRRGSDPTADIRPRNTAVRWCEAGDPEVAARRA